MLRKLRSYIDDQNTKIAEEKKAAKSKVAEAKEKVRYHKVLSFLFLKWRNCKLIHVVPIVYVLSTGKNS
jgi:hypothetical protein